MGSTLAVVHLSHVVVEPEWRGTGLAAWLRALPIATARRCAELHQIDEPSRIILVAEMEHPDAGGDPARITRLRAYERAGFRKLDPAVVPYEQPDFRDPAEIGSNPRPVPLALIVRCVAAEHEDSLLAQDVRSIVTALYTIYAAGSEVAHMAPLWNSVLSYPEPGTKVSLLPPTAQ